MHGAGGGREVSESIGINEFLGGSIIYCFSVDAPTPVSPRCAVNYPPASSLPPPPPPTVLSLARALGHDTRVGSLRIWL